MRVALGIVLLAACSAAPPGRAQEPTRDDLLRAVQAKLAEAAKTAGPSVVTVVVSRSGHYPKPPAGAPWKLGGFDPDEFRRDSKLPERDALAGALDLSKVAAIRDHGYAGGVVLDASGLVLTPYHVIDGATKVYVHLGDRAGSYADVRAADARSDLAVLKLLAPPPGLRAVTFADVRTADGGGRKATVFTGKLCVLLTRPYTGAPDLGGPTAGFGSVANVRHRRPNPDHATPTRAAEYGTFLEYDLKDLGPGGRPRPGADAARGGPNAGVTGGALFDLSGGMIGLTNAAAVAWGTEFGPGYAVPADDHFRRVVDVLRRGEEVEYGFLGVTLPQDRDRRPVVVGDLHPGGPAAAAGLRKDDVITHVDGRPVETFDDLLLHVGSALAGSRVGVTVDRFGRKADLTVTLAKFRHDLPHLASVRPDPVFGLRVDYGSVLAQGSGGGPGAGVCVREVADDSPAARQFKALGDNPQRWLVTRVDGAPVADPADFYKAARGREKVKLSLLDPKDDTRRELTLP